MKQQPKRQGKIMVSYRLDEDIVEAIRHHATESNISQTAVIESIIGAALRIREAPKPFKPKYIKIA